ncbi:S41 family peptidase [Hymenobacter norwichensis]|uniref:S41 family peptidase n=1 Tax=Hymenobacter norwichensis TaxID=223903 RepID=UPI0003B4009D|nr:S41 family peptidase [Hymenobacter norwichensis]
MRLPHLVAPLLLATLTATAQAPTPRTVQNLETFARLYGYVRYFHPSDEAAATNWDKFAVLGVEQVATAQTDAELQKTLLALFQPIAPTLQLVPASKSVVFKVKTITPPNPKNYEVISWQHQGMGQGNKQSPYYSYRLNRAVPEVVDEVRGAAFGSLTRAVDAKPYRGQEFRYTAFVRNAKPTHGHGALWARVDCENQKMGFFDNMGDRPIVSGKWQEYEIQGRIDAKATQLFFGTMLLDSGQVQVDEMRVAVRENDTWKTVFTTGFEDDKPGHFPSSISAKANPGTATSRYSYLVSETDAAAGSRYVNINYTRPQSKAPASTSVRAPLFAKQAAIGEVVQEDIGSNLRCVLPLALYGTKTATYPAADTAVHRALQRQIRQLPMGDVLSSDSRAAHLAAVVITWNIFQHFYPYFAVTNSNWAAALPEALRSAYPEQSGTDFLLTLQRLTAQLHDGHVRVGSYRNPLVGAYRLPIEWEWVQNQLVVTRIAGDTLAIKRGDIVTTINGQPAAAHFRNAEQYISAATPGWLHYRSATETTMGPRGQAMQLQVQDAAGQSRAVTLRHSLQYNQFNTSEPTPETFRLLSPGVYYLNLDQLPMEEVNKHMAELTQAKTIICDLRGYPKSNHMLISHLLSKPDTAGHWMRVPQFIYPDQKNVAGYANMGWNMKPSKPHLTARVIFITDGRAISYAESYMGFIEGYKLATIIGQPTAGTNGNINPFTVPGSYRISWTGMEVRKHDGSQHHGVGIKPNIYLEKTIQGVREGRDEFLEKAIELAKAP